MNFRKKLLALFLLFFIPFFGINHFNFVNNKQNQMIPQLIEKDALTDNTKPIITSIYTHTFHKELDQASQRYKFDEVIDINYNLGEPPQDFSEILIQDITNSIDFDITDLNVDYSYAGHANYCFSYDLLDVGISYKYTYRIKATYLNGDEILSSEKQTDFKIDDPNDRSIIDSYSVDQTTINSTHFDLSIIQNSDILTQNGIVLNLYEEKSTEDELIESKTIHDWSYSVDLKNLDINRDYYIDGTVNFQNENFSDGEISSYPLPKIEFKTLKHAWISNFSLIHENNNQLTVNWDIDLYDETLKTLNIKIYNQKDLETIIAEKDYESTTAPLTGKIVFDGLKSDETYVAKIELETNFGTLIKITSKPVYIDSVLKTLILIIVFLLFIMSIILFIIWYFKSKIKK